MNSFLSLEELKKGVNMVYRTLNGLHYFTSDDIGINITDKDYDTAYSQIRPCLNHLIKLEFNVDIDVPFEILLSPENILFMLEKRAEIRRKIDTRTSVQENRPDRIADLLDFAAETIRNLRKGDHEY